VAVAAACSGGCTERAKDPANELPHGSVDRPKAGDTIRPGRTVVGGWAIDDSGVAEIRLYFDGHYKASARLNVVRPDVGQAYPRYAHRGDVYGWNVEVDFGTALGPHTIVVQAVDDNGATTDIGTIPVMMVAAKSP
jgi:hypothetical protein